MDDILLQKNSFEIDNYIIYKSIHYQPHSQKIQTLFM